MNFPDKLTLILNRERYSEKVATLIAHNVAKDGRKREHSSVPKFLYRSINGNFFTVTLIHGPGERETFAPVTMEDALLLYDGWLEERLVPFLDAFPGCR